MASESYPRDFSWTDKANCRDLLFGDSGQVSQNAISTFFVEAGRVIDQETLRMCTECPVRMECLEHSFGGFDGRPMPAGYFAGFSYGQRSSQSLEDLKEIVEQESSSYRTAR